MLEFLSGLALPALLGGVALLLLFHRRRASALFDEFLLGAKEGVGTSVRLLPTLVALMVGVSMLRASGFPALLSTWLSPVCARLGIPAEILPLVFLRPVSGSGSNAMLIDLFDAYGADSFAGLCASVLLGSSDTMIYVIAVYFSAVSVKRTRHALPAATLVAVLCLLLSCLVVRLVFGEEGYLA